MTVARSGGARRSQKKNPVFGLIVCMRVSSITVTEHAIMIIIMIKIMNLYSAFSIFIYSNALYKQVIYGQRPDHNTGNYVPYSLR